MKKRTFIFAIMVTTLSASLGFAFSNIMEKDVNKAKADVIDHYMARFLNQDKHSLGSTGANYSIPKFDNTSNLTWTMSYGGYRNKDSDPLKYSSFQLGGGYYAKSDENATKCLNRSLSAASYSGTVFGDIYEDLGTHFETYSAAIVSDQYINNIQDIAFYWDSLTEIYGEPEHAHANGRIIYLLEGEDEWKLLKRDDGEGGTHTKRIA